MACEECRKIQEQDVIYWYRWKIADIGISACSKHTQEIFDVLNKYQKENF